MDENDLQARKILEEDLKACGIRPEALYDLVRDIDESPVFVERRVYLRSGNGGPRVVALWDPEKVPSKDDLALEDYLITVGLGRDRTQCRITGRHDYNTPAPQIYAEIPGSNLEESDKPLAITFAEKEKKEVSWKKRLDDTIQEHFGDYPR